MRSPTPSGLCVVRPMTGTSVLLRRESCVTISRDCDTVHRQVPPRSPPLDPPAPHERRLESGPESRSRVPDQGDISAICAIPGPSDSG